MRKTSFHGWQIAALWAVRAIFLAIGLTWPAADALSAADQDNGVSGYFRNWFAQVDEEREEQPDWVAPIVTTTPRLEEQVREDFIRRPGVSDSHNLLPYPGPYMAIDYTLPFLSPILPGSGSG